MARLSRQCWFADDSRLSALAADIKSKLYTLEQVIFAEATIQQVYLLQREGSQ
jgi:hypothetical protein